MQKPMNFRTLARTCVTVINRADVKGILCTLGVFALMLLSHANASAQSLPSCAWRLEINGSGITNAFYPDTDATYWTMPVDTTQWKQVILQGQYPQSRFFSFTTYVARGSTADSTYDINIDPDVGSRNPFRRGSSGQQHNYTVNVGGPSGQANHVNFGDTRLAWIVYRIYVADRGLDPMAGVPLPAVTLVDANGGRHSIAPCHTPRDQQINLVIADLHAGLGPRRSGDVLVVHREIDQSGFDDVAAGGEGLGARRLELERALRGIGGDDHRRGSERGFQLRIGEVGDALEDREVGDRCKRKAGEDDRLPSNPVG